MNEKILERAKKLLALSEDASSENEAMIAARRLHSLLAKHNISMSDLERSEEEVDETCMEETINWPWKRKVMQAIASLYFCETFYTVTRKNYAKYFIVGSETNRTFAGIIISNIFKTIEREAKIASIDTHGCVLSSFITSFRNGAAASIAKRCYYMIKSAKEGTMEDDEGNNLPALLDVYDQSKLNNSDWFNLMHPNAKIKSHNTRSSDPLGFASGKEAGDRVTLNRTLHKNSSPKLLGNK